MISRCSPATSRRFWTARRRRASPHPRLIQREYQVGFQLFPAPVQGGTGSIHRHIPILLQQDRNPVKNGLGRRRQHPFATNGSDRCPPGVRRGAKST